MSKDKEPEESSAAGAPRKLTAAAREALNMLIARGMPMSRALAEVRARPDAFEEAKPSASARPARALVGRPPAASKEDVDRYFEALALRLAEIGVVTDDHATPIAPGDLEKLLNRARLPYAYVAFLRRYGGSRCRLWSHSHAAVEHSHLITMQRKARAMGERLGHPMPEGAFAILSELAATYHFVPAEGGIDEPVHVLLEDLPDRSGPYFASVLGWVDSLAEKAGQAWESGYFRIHPNGTSA